MRQFINSDVICLESVDSTNDEIKRRIENINKTTWLLANSQTNGKGRNGNSWYSSEENFSGSIIFFPTILTSHFHLFGFFFGVALFNTIKKMVTGIQPMRRVGK